MKQGSVRNAKRTPWSNVEKKFHIFAVILSEFDSKRFLPRIAQITPMSLP
jgi:hypothetical protein